jgi:predicted transcriptional regulator
MKKREVMLGTGTAEGFGRRFIDAWKKAERGEGEEARERVYFADVATLAKVLSEKRVELLRCLQQHPHLSVRALAKQVGRDYSNVHADVALLKQIGLINEADGLVVPYTRIHAEIDLAA